ncbi:hypothetical protein INR49_022514 [Caranx melampygus]|nr:hypothetical protein INR49_022514 [Caranx melampygus]
MSTEPESTENESANQESPAEESHAKTTSEKPEIESEEVSKETEEMSRGHEEETRRGTEEKEGSADQGPETNGPDSAADPPEPQTHQKPGDDERLQDLDQKPGPAGGAAGPERPSRPVGTEFVRPVVGYFCHLCQVIYADEDEAKLQHCSSDAHYRKYQEKTGKNPWTS